MEKELYARLLKVVGEHKINIMEPKGLLDISSATLFAIYAHIEEKYGYRNHDLNLCSEAIDLIKRYR